MSKRISITLTDTEEKAIEEIMERYGFMTASAAISLAVTDYLNSRDAADELYRFYLVQHGITPYPDEPIYPTERD